MKKLIPFALAGTLLCGCNAAADLLGPSFTQSQELRLGELEVRNTELLVEMDAARGMARLALESRDLGQLEAAEIRLSAALDEQARVAGEATQLIREAGTPVTGFMRLVEKVPGPWQPFIPMLSTILAVFAGKRSRKWAWITAKNALSVGVLDTVKNVARTVGSMHSSAASEDAAISGPGGYPGPGDTVPPNLT